MFLGVDGTQQVVLDSSAIVYSVKNKTFLTRYEGGEAVDSNSKSNGLSTGTIIGIVCGVVALIALIALIVWNVRKRKRAPFSKPSTNYEVVNGPGDQGATGSKDANPAGRVSNSGKANSSPAETMESTPTYYSGYQQVPLTDLQHSPHQQGLFSPVHPASAPSMQSYPPPPASPTSHTHHQSYAQQQGYHDYPAEAYNSKSPAPRGPEAITTFDVTKTTPPRGPEALPVGDGFRTPQNPHS